MADDHEVEIQEDLQAYLTKNNINSLFVSIVENVLLQKPSNPIAFIIDYLYKEHPESAQESLQSSLGAIISNGQARPGNSVPIVNQMMLDITLQGQSKSDSDDEDCLVGDLLITPAAGPVIDSRRTSVSAESVDLASLRLRRSQLLIIEKSAEVTESLLKIVSKSPLLRALDAEQRDMIVQAFTGPITMKSGEKIIQQGESGDTFYLLEDGSVDVFVMKKDEEAKHVHTYKAGDSFGELAIMYNAPRAATCTAQNDCKLWTLDRNSFRLIVVTAAMQKRETYHAFLARVPILQTLTEMEMLAFADALLEEEYQDGQVVCNEGEDGDYFYIIKDGIAQCSQIARNKNHNIVATLTTGHYFGEIVLLTKKPRQATVTATGVLKVLALERATFRRVFGNLDEIMKRNMEDYNKYAASGI